MLYATAGYYCYLFSRNWKSLTANTYADKQYLINDAKFSEVLVHKLTQTIYLNVFVCCDNNVMQQYRTQFNLGRVYKQTFIVTLNVHCGFIINKYVVMLDTGSLR